MSTKYRGETITFDVSFKDENDQLFDPSDQDHRVYDCFGADRGSLTPNKQAVGIYRVAYLIPSDATYGTWKLVSTGTQGSSIDIETYCFTIVRK